MRDVGRRGNFPKGMSLGKGTNFDTYRDKQRIDYLRAKVEEYIEYAEVIRVDGGAFCSICDLPYRSHDRNTKVNFPGFVQLCNGKIGKL